MKKLSLLLFSMLTLFSFGQKTSESGEIQKSKPDKTPIEIANCGSLVQDQIITSSIVPGAVLYHFNLQNQSTGNQLTLTSPSNQISLFDFNSIITYNSQLSVRVKAELPNGTQTLWSKKCKFTIGDAPETTNIENPHCDSEITDPSTQISASAVLGANCYTFYVTNLTTGQTETVGCQSNNFFVLGSLSMALNSGDVIQVNVSYTIDGIESDISKPCEFKLSLKEKPFGLEIECGSTILDLDQLIYCTNVNGADCYTFYVTNITTGQSDNTGCITDNFFSLDNLNLNYHPGDILSISVSYTIGKTEFSNETPCELIIGKDIGRMRFCHVIQTDYDASDVINFNTASKTTIPGQNVGNHFYLTYLDNSAQPLWAPAVWESDAQNMFNTAIAVLEHIDAFLTPNFVNDNCGNPNQRMIIALRPYYQDWVNLNLYTNALAVAGQQVAQVDVNYLSQMCIETPTIQLATVNAPHGGYGAITVGTIFFNPTIDYFNSAYPNPTGAGEVDLYSVILHEFTHILGINIDDFKFHDELVSGTDHLNHPDLLNCTPATNYNALSTSTCDQVHLDGTSDKIYAPTSFSSGSSLSHFVDECSGTPQGGNVMNPWADFGDDSKRFYHQREIDALQTLGYNFTNPFNGMNYIINNTAHVVGNHDGLQVNYGPGNFGFDCDSDPYIPIIHYCNDSWPMILNPLDNDINASTITEAVVKTGSANATVNIVGTGNNQLAFTATQPGIYTIAYIPASTDREGLPTFIQVSVQSCGDQDLSNLTCHDSQNCSQLCFTPTFNEHVLLRGNQFTEPSGFGTNNGFNVKATSANNDFTGTSYSPCYSSVFFWVDTDIADQYTISMDRNYHEVGNLSSGNPDAKFFVYLMKSSEVLDGQINQAANEFPNFSGYDAQLVYEETITTDHIWTPENISTCFVSQGEYDMLVFFCQQYNGVSTHRKGTTGVFNLEFMEYELPTIDQSFEACLPEILELGDEFCMTMGNTVTWTSFNDGIVSNDQIYSPGNITTSLIDQFIFTLEYSQLPNTAIFPTDNSMCEYSSITSVTIDNCCTDGSVPINHPLTPTSSSRTFGVDVDADANGALYYTGEFPADIGFGSQYIPDNANLDIGFIAKFQDDCAEWLVETPYRESHIDVTNSGSIFYSGHPSLNPNGDIYFAEINPNNGSEVWNWNSHITGPGVPVVTDFKLNEQDQHIIIVGNASGDFFYDGNLVSVSPNDVFVLKLAYNGTYISSNTIGNTAVLPLARVAVNANEVYLAYQYTFPLWRIVKLDYTTLSTQSTLRDFSGPVGWNIKAMDFDGSNVSFITLSNNNIFTVTGGTTLLLSVTGQQSGIINLNTSLDVNNSEVLGSVYDSHLYSQDLDLYNGSALVSYVTNDQKLRMRSYDPTASMPTMNWEQTATPIGWIGSKGIKGTPEGIFNTGAFFPEFTVDGNSWVVQANTGATTFYGIKYDINGTPQAMVIPDNNNAQVPIDFNNGNKNGITAGTDGIQSYEASIKIYPNPGKDVFTLESEGEHNVIIMNSNGQQIMNFTGNDLSRFDLSEFSTGLYLVKIQTSSEVQIIKLIKE